MATTAAELESSKLQWEIAEEWRRQKEERAKRVAARLKGPKGSQLEGGKQMKSGKAPKKLKTEPEKEAEEHEEDDDDNEDNHKQLLEEMDNPK